MPAGPEPTEDYQPIAERPGTVIGPYKLWSRSARGALGVVFVAEQQHPIRRKVALKIIKPGMDTREVIARFEAERQALALMDHPNIARVFDAGTTESGRPYFVMELVKGIPITDYCDPEQLRPATRLELFVSVCQAVQHAHQKGIIHRDLKPSNVLVAPHDGVPVPKVIDFGIAKAIGQRLTDKTIFTRFAQMIGTPLYMSPEQAELTPWMSTPAATSTAWACCSYELLDRHDAVRSPATWRRSPSTRFSGSSARKSRRSRARGSRALGTRPRSPAGADRSRPEAERSWCRASSTGS